MAPEQEILVGDTGERERAIGHRGGPLLVLGAAGTGKTELLARRLAHLAATGTEPGRVLALTATRATARRLRERSEALLPGPFEELWIGTWDELGERILREHSEAAGLDPFFDVLGSAERLAILLDRLDELPLRRHEIRGNPAGLLARLLARIDALKAARVGPTTLAERARGEAASAADEAAREAASRELEFAELYTAHDGILAAAGSLDRGDVFLALDCLLVERPDVRRELVGRFEYVMVDELEETSPAQRALLEALAPEGDDHLYALESEGEPERELGGWFRDLHPQGDVLVLSHRFREPSVHFWRCGNERAQAQALAREVERLIAAGTPPESICAVVADAGADGGPVAAAMEERGIPFHLSGPAALFQRPEVRDAIAWLRVLADPDDSPAAT
ncbi:MAG TPA: ATP-dependent helicase, partial [Solirubrobacterales bacterium]|nr:ATP-dependent helicase [Solirubrobacterales bacterium]